MLQSYKKTSGKNLQFPENHPIVSLIYLLLFMFSGAILFGLISILIVIAMGNGEGELQEVLAGTNPNKITAIRIIQTLSSIGTFIVPAWVMSKIEARRTQYFSFAHPKALLTWIFAALLIIASAPLLELSGMLNQSLKLPPLLSDLEEWMQNKEADLKVLTQAMLSGITYADLGFNLFMIALVPAIGEELVFRGILQNILSRWTKNHTAGIWITAIIFSAIHMQFYGFLPRLFMGVLFGYLLLWGKTLWLPILAHFINNASVVIYAFILQKQGQSLDVLDSSMELNPLWYIVSLLACATILYYFWKNSEAKHGEQLD